MTVVPRCGMRSPACVTSHWKVMKVLCFAFVAMEFGYIDQLQRSECQVVRLEDRLL